MAESMSLDFATRMHQKRKHNLDSPNESSERETHSRRDVKEDGTFISRALDLSDSQQKAVPANGGHNGKRPRLYEPLSQTSNGKKSSKLVTLPAEIWQHIFCFVPPISLGLVLRVNHAFHDYLDEHRNGEELPAPSNCIVRPMKAQAIWCASRKRFSPELPRSLHDLTEVALWRLLRGSNCQICGKFRITSEPLSTANPWRNGLGNTGPRIIWPFGIRTCASCLTDVTKTEMELLLSSDFPSFLLQGLPFAYISNKSHVITHTSMRHSTAIPSGLALTKRYYKPHIETIERRFVDVRALGGPSVEEWIKGLAEQGQQRVNAIIQWEQYEIKSGLKIMNTPSQPKHMTDSTVLSQHIPPSRTVKSDTLLERFIPRVLGLQPTKGGNYVNPLPPKKLTSSFTGPKIIRPCQPTWIGFGPPAGQVHFAQRTKNHQLYQPKPERSIRDVNETKAARRANIERRCAALNPPILPNLLNHMESFHAALQISQPMTDLAWQVLKPRLLAQLPYAERREKERAQETESIEEEPEKQCRKEIQLEDTKDGLDWEWETCQGPVRVQLAALTDNVINTRWSSGKSITKETAPKFAADVLVQVRQRFYAQLAECVEGVPAHIIVAKAEPPKRPPVRNLVLENMKWVFDKKIKPLTDSFQRDLFLCNDCDGNSKLYGFEGVVQHFAAKHTTELSMGNIVVHWRAEWPEHSPFHPNPNLLKTTSYEFPTPTPTPGSNASSMEFTEKSIKGADSLSNGSSGPDNITHISTLPSTTPNILASSTTLPAQPCPPIASGSGLGVNTFQMGFKGVHTSNAVSTAQNLVAPQHSQVLPVNANSNPSSHPWSNGTAASYATASQGLPFGAFVSQPSIPFSTSYTDGSSITSLGCTTPAQQTELYKRKVDEMARHAKEVFSGLGCVKDIPGSVCIFATIQHTVLRFEATFAHDLTLQMFIDGLDHNATMRPVRNVNGIACKICVGLGTAAEAGPQHHGKVVGDRRLYTLPHLVNHFKTAHVDPFNAPGPIQSTRPAAPDWRKDMIELPDESIISSLATAPGMTDSTLALVSTVLPYALIPSPSQGATVTSQPSNSTDGSNTYALMPQVSFHETPRDEEYDPLRPAIVHKPVMIDGAFHVPASHARIVNPQFGEHTLQKAYPEECQSLAGSNLYNEQSAAKPSSRKSASEDYYSPYRHVKHSGRADCPAWFRYTGEQNETLCVVERPRKKVMDEMEHFCESSRECSNDGRGRPSVIQRKLRAGIHGGDDATDQGFGLGSNFRPPNPHESRTTDLNRAERHRQTLREDEASGDRCQYTNPSKRKSDTCRSQAHFRNAIPMKDCDPHEQPDSISQMSYQEGSHSSSHIPVLCEATSSEDPDPVAYTRLTRKEVQFPQISQMPQYRVRPTFPPREVPETALYRTRSPVEEARCAAVYQARGTPLQGIHGADRPLSYESRTRNQNEFVVGRVVQPRYQSHVESLPPRTEEFSQRELPSEQTKYTTARSTRRMTQSGHIRHAPAAEVACYEVDGRLYLASQVRYAEAPGRVISS